MRYVVRKRDEHGRALYWTRSRTWRWMLDQRRAYKYDDREAAQDIAEEEDGARVVRLLTRDEAKRRYAAGVLRRCAREIRGHATGLETEKARNLSIVDANYLEAEAAALWPAGAKGAKGERR